MIESVAICSMLILNIMDEIVSVGTSVTMMLCTTWVADREARMRGVGVIISPPVTNTRHPPCLETHPPGVVVCVWTTFTMARPFRCI